MNVSLAPLPAAPTSGGKRLIAFPRACGASCLVVSLAIAVEAVVMFAVQPNTFRKSLGSSIVSFDLADSGKLSAAVYSHSVFDAYDRADFSLATRACAADTSIFRVLPSQARPKCVVGHPVLPRFYVGTWDGGIYALDVSGRKATCRRVARHPEKYITQMQCSPDGSLVVATGYKVTAGWNAASGELLWQGRLGVSCLAFAERAPRLFCGLKGGAIIELDPERGITLATIPAQSSSLKSISVSPHGERLASVTAMGGLALSDVAKGSVLWSARQTFATCPTFLDGNLLLTAEFDGQRELLVLRDVSCGARQASLCPDEPVSRIKRGGDKSFYAWGMDSPVRKWTIQGTGRRVAMAPAGVVSTS